MGNLKQGIANKDTVKASENYHDADADKQTAYTNAVSQAEGIINQTTIQRLTQMILLVH